MAFSPIAFIAPNYSDYGTYWLKAYLPGSTTPKPLATDSAGTTTFAKLQLNVNGFFKSAGGALITPYVEGAYDAYLFETEAEADANNTAAAIRLADNITPLVDEQLRSDLAAGTVDVNLNNDITQTYDFDTVALMVASTVVFPFGKPFAVKERATGSGGGAKWYAIATSSVTPSPSIAYGNVVQSSQNPTISFILEDTKFPGATSIETNHNVKQWGALGNNSNTDNLAVQAILDSLVQYSANTQNSGSFQTPVTIHFPDGDYLFQNKVSKSYRNNMNFTGNGKIWAATGFTDDCLMQLLACSHMNIEDLFFEGDGYKVNSALKVSGDGFTGAKRNSTNIKFRNLFFHDIGATGANSYVVDTLSPNGVPGDYSIDDSEFIGCNWLGSYGGAIRLASSEIKIDGGKMSFISLDNVNPNINLGNGSSVNITDLVWTGAFAAPFKPIEADTGASIGRVSLSGCYSESTDEPIYSQNGGTCRMLSISDGYYAGATIAQGGTKDTFVLFNGACKAQLQMTGVTFQSSGYKFIDLGDSGSYIGDAQTSTTSFKSFYPQIKNGAFIETKMAIQTSQNGDKKRIIEAKYELLNDIKLQLFVDGTDDFTRLRFITLQDALKYVDQSGYTECEVLVFIGTYVIDAPFTFAGDLTITGNGTANSTIDIQSPLTVRNGRLTIAAATVNYMDLAIRNRNSTVSLITCIITANSLSNDDYLVDHFNGQTLFSSCNFKDGGSGANIDNNYRSTGSINFFSNSFTNTIARASSASTAMCRTLTIGDIPTVGTWTRGSIAERDEVNSGQQLQEICTVSGNPGTWRGTIITDAT